MAITSASVEGLPVSGAVLIATLPIGDERGWFRRLLDCGDFIPERPTFEVVNVNNSFSSEMGTLRGLHWQEGKHGEAKLVRCIRGKVLDLIVDVRPGSPTFGASCTVSLDADDRHLVYVPNGCAHGILSLAPDSEIIYFVDQPYAPEAERGMRWDDPFANLDLPVLPRVVSVKDASWPIFAG